MGDLLILGATERRMELEIYGKILQLTVREPTREEQVKIPLQLQKMSSRKQIEATCKLGLRHIISIEGLGIKNDKGKQVALVTEPDKKGYQDDWKRRLAGDSIGIKVGVMVASELYRLGQPKSGEDDEELEDFDPEDDLGEAGAAPQTEGGKAK